MDTHLHKELPAWSINLEWMFGVWLLTPAFFEVEKEDEQFKFHRKGIQWLFFVVVWQKNTWKGTTVKKAGFHA